MRSNCLLWALAAWLRLGRPHRRRLARRVHFDLRTSDYTRVLHFGVMVRCRCGEDRYRYLSFKPLDPKHKACPPPLFKGRVYWGDR